VKNELCMRAFVVGNIALDETICVAELPAPGASILGQEMSRDLGGKGANQAIVLGRAGLECTLIAAVGEDARGAEIRGRLAAEPLRAELVVVPDVASDFSIILAVDGGENCVITTNAAATALTSAQAVGGLADARAGDLLVLQGNLSAETTVAVLAEGRRRGLLTALNPSPLRPFLASLWPLVEVVFLNRGEAEALGGAAALLSAGVRSVVMTLGSDGAVLLEGSGEQRVPARPCPVIDPTGAGDSFMATALASATRRSTALDELSLRHATRAAALTVSRPGTVQAFPTRAELEDILSES
jgi:ribokinase